jgi:hypothetical protein
MIFISAGLQQNFAFELPGYGHKAKKTTAY